MARMRHILLLISLTGILSCAGRILQVDKADEALKVEEFENKVEVVETAEPPPEPVIKAEPKAAKKAAKAPAKKAAAKAKPKGPRQPDLEDREGFDGRRPLVDPFRAGEKVTFEVSYFNMTAGELTMEVKPFVNVNGQRAYHFELNAKSSSFFSRIYTVEDRAVTYLSYDDLVPLSLQVSIKESKQLGETRTYFDWKNMRASYWQKKIVKDKGERSKKLEWDLLPYSQNVISAAYYLRVFKLEPGKKLAFRVADEGKNIVFTGEVLRRETLDTPVGKLKTIVVQPRVTADGAFKPIGDILVWLTDDDRKLFVRLESKIKIGTIVASLKSIEQGRE